MWASHSSGSPLQAADTARHIHEHSMAQHNSVHHLSIFQQKRHQHLTGNCYTLTPDTKPHCPTTHQLLKRCCTSCSRGARGRFPTPCCCCCCSTTSLLLLLLPAPAPATRSAAYCRTAAAAAAAMRAVSSCRSMRASKSSRILAQSGSACSCDAWLRAASPPPPGLAAAAWAGGGVAGKVCSAKSASLRMEW